MSRGEKLCERGIKYTVAGKHAKAIKCYNKAIELDANVAALYHNRALSYYFLGQYDKAVRDYTLAIRIELEDESGGFHHANVWNYSRRGHAYAELGEYDKAIADYDKAIELAPDNKEYQEFRAKLISAR